MSAPHGIHMESVQSRRASSAFWGHTFHVGVDQQGAATTGPLYETALESSHYHTIHPLTTQGMARSIARALRKVPALQAQLDGFRVLGMG